MVEIECPEDPTWRSITAQRGEKGVELRLVSAAGPTGTRYNVLAASAARCIAHLLLAAAEHPTEGKTPGEMPLVARGAASDRVELRLWTSPPKPLAMLTLATARRLAHALQAESLATEPPSGD